MCFGKSEKLETTIDPTQLKTAGRTLNYAASIYDPVMNIVTFGRIKNARAEAIDIMDFKETDNILDVGCGTGAMTIKIAERLKEPGHITGIDAAINMIKVANRNLNKTVLGNKCSFKAALAEKLPFQSELFDFCFSSMLYHHLPIELKIKSLKECFRVLKPEGIFIVIDISKPGNVFAKILALAGYILLIQKAIKENIDGVLPELICRVGFSEPEVLKRKWALISAYRAFKPEI